MDADTVDMQISVRGGPFTSDLDYILFEGENFTIPNPSVFADGLDLIAGENEIRVRSISFSGSVSSAATIKVTLLQDSDLGMVPGPPTEFFVEQKMDAVILSIQGPSNPSFRGMNFYASRAPGGGSLGYQKINLKLVTDFESERIVTDLIDLEAESKIATNLDGTVAADPLYLKVQQTQVTNPDVIERLEDVELTPELAAAITEKQQQELLKTDFVKTFEIPEGVSKILTSYRVQRVEEKRYYSFLHNRFYGPENTPATIAIGEFASLPSSEPLYYVARAVYFDSALNREIESPNSIERVAKPIRIERNIGTPPQNMTQALIQRNLISAINRTKPELSTIEGSVVRDTVIDPISVPLTNTAFKSDFSYRIQSFETLLQIDVDFSTGQTIPVSRSSYKQALRRVYGLQNDQATQSLIDLSFEQLASRFGKFRLSGIRSRGFVTFFTRNRPKSTVFIPLGTRIASGNVVFVTTSDAVMDQGSLASHFNPSTGTYSIDVPIQAQNPGVEGNVSTGQIRTIIDTIPGLSIINGNRTFGGKSRETNLQLANRVLTSLSSVDTGTEQGLNAIVAQMAGVEEASVIASGDDLMQRDLFEGQHWGGKVDVWVRGQSLALVTDSFAFSYETAHDVQFVPIGNPSDLVFRSLDKRLSPNNPISSFIYNRLLGYGLRNATTGEYFDLKDVKHLNYRDIQLSNEVIQPVFGLGNIILGDYKYLTSTKFVLPRQPVSSIVSVEGSVSGVLSEDSFRLVKPLDPALEGNSIRSEDYLDIVQTNGIPTGSEFSVSNEPHILIGEFPESLNNLGADTFSIRVFNANKTVEYRGPWDPSGLADFTIIPGTQVTPATIKRTDISQIRSGESVLVDYSHTENFTVSYRINQIISLAQETIEKQTHLSSDVLVKEAFAVPLDLTATLTFEQGLSKSEVRKRVLSNLSSFVNSLSQGSRITPSQIISSIQNTAGVVDVLVPLTKLARSVGSQVVRESILSDSTLLLGTSGFPLSTKTVSVYLLTDEFEAVTSNGGGSGETLSGVYQDDIPLSLRTSSPFQLREKAGQGYIIGQQGLSIPGYSDDATILSKFPDLTPTEIAAKRAQLTGNRAMVSLPTDDRPDLHRYSVTYTVDFLRSGSKTLQASELEYFTLTGGQLDLTFVESK